MRKLEYGGYIELDEYTGSEYYNDTVSLNCGRSCLSYLIKARGIKKVYIPSFCCDTVKQGCENVGALWEYYSINSDFTPNFNIKLKENEYIYIVNYYGQLNDSMIEKMIFNYKRVILDYAQAFFQKPLPNVDTLYSCRKFFGVTDGAYLVTNVKLQEELEIDYSYNRMNFLLGRFEKTASEFYSEYISNNRLFDTEPIKLMSRLTQNLLRGIEYDKIKDRRTKNALILDKKLKCINKINIIPVEGMFSYPLYIENGCEIREKMQKLKIYIPTLWPDVLKRCDSDSIEYQYSKNILPLPIDQRYNEEDMEVICRCIFDLI